MWEGRSERVSARLETARAFELYIGHSFSAFDTMRADEFQLVYGAPRKGSRGTTEFFVHPESGTESAFGFPIEMAEDPDGVDPEGK
jgi:hypothetical protein